MAWLTLACATLVMTGCATSGMFAPLPANADFGAPPNAHEEVIRAHFEQTLKDPESARYRIGKPERAYGNEALIQGGGIRWIGYLVPVEVNAKNSYGGYVGFKPYLVLFQPGGTNIRSVVPGTSHPLLHRLGTP